MSKLHWIWFANLQGIKMRDKYTLLEAFGDPQTLYEADSRTLIRMGVPSVYAERIIGAKSLERAELILEDCIDYEIDLLPINDARYPDRLRNIDNPPLLLYTLGQLPDLEHRVSIAVVGTRKASREAVEIAYDFSHELAESEIFILSGMATGIDLAANRAAIDASGQTIAVLGCGLDICYPESSRSVYNQILDGHGCLISEYPPGTRPVGRNFPIRNRIMSGLSMGVLLVAAPVKSGALITANLAADQGRDVFVVPGGIDDPLFEGSNDLIKQGATAVTDTHDIVMQYRAQYPGYFTTPAPRWAGRMRIFQGAEEPHEAVAAPSFTYRAGRDPDRKSVIEELIAAIKPKPIRRPSEKKPTPKKEEPAPAPTSVPENPLGVHADVLSTLSQQAQTVAASVAKGCRTIDQIVENTGIDSADALTELTLLEVMGVVSRTEENLFAIN